MHKFSGYLDENIFYSHEGSGFLCKILAYWEESGFLSSIRNNSSLSTDLAQNAI